MTLLPPTHTEFQEQVVQLATLHGWRHLHVRRSIGKGNRWTTTTSIKGWPDLVLMRPPTGLIFAELKVPPDKPTPEQEEVLAYLGGFPFAVAEVWYPADWDRIEEVLAPRRGPNGPETIHVVITCGVCGRPEAEHPRTLCSP